MFPAIGHRFNIWWLDPLGAGLLSLFIIFDWGGTCFENVIRLSGSAADEHLQQKIMYVAYRFSSLVKGYKNVQSYHAGDGVWVEVDILLDPQEPLIQAHDVAETLQYCLEGLTEVDRAFVTVDCELSDFPRYSNICLTVDRYFLGPYRSQYNTDLDILNPGNPISAPHEEGSIFLFCDF